MSLGTSIRQYIYSLIAVEINRVIPFFPKILYHSSTHAKDEILFACLANTHKEKFALEENLVLSAGDACVLFNGTFNFHLDIQTLLSERVKPTMTRSSRVVAVMFNPYLRYLFRIADFFGLRRGPEVSTFITETNLSNLARLSGFEVVRKRPVVHFPFFLFGVGKILNLLLSLIPFVKRFSIAWVVILRPLMVEKKSPSLTIIVPARNEKGNIEAAITRLMPFAKSVSLEVIFVEGHSTDATWQEILRVKTLYEKNFPISAFQQSGKGKADAVRLGCAKANCEIITILDADLTMPPEMLTRFYTAYCHGLGDFINGSRLVYPMEGEAMRFLNRLGNVFFAKALSYVLDENLGDSLCGTKLFAKTDYERMVAWRKRFGEFDPFGDFEIIFPAAIFGLGIAEVPIRYLDRTYGQTSISRFRHGFMLLKMTLVGFFKVKLNSFG